jgi:hypothetical protein
MLGTFVGQATRKQQSLQLQKSQFVAAVSTTNGTVQGRCVNIDPFSNGHFSLGLDLLTR